MSEAGRLVGIQVQKSAVDANSCVLRIMRSALLGEGTPILGRGVDRLLAALVTIDGIDDAAASDNVVMLRKDDAMSWDGLVPIAASVVRRFVVDVSNSGDPPGVEPSPAGARSDEQVQAAVQAVIDRRFNPAVARHRGAVRVHGYRAGELRVEMTGGCQGCAASQMTLQHGLAAMLRAEVPEVQSIVDCSDHRAGADPYYRP